jgi:MHS family alpha-ketoglutarate permease-like MFS transporter
LQHPALQAEPEETLETLVQPPAPAASAAADQRRRIRAIFASASGNLVEWYDFFVYTAFSLYFARQFFPAGDQTTQLMNTMLVFGIGFVMRPLGGYIFGYIADKHGRRISMVTSVLMMCAGSFLVAILPTYASIGVWAGVLLTLCRMLQGLSVGGEYGAAATYMSEVALAGRRGFYSSIQYVTLIGGQLLGTLVLVILQRTLGEDALRAWAWRIPFAIGGVAGLVALYLRRSLHETTTAETRKRKEAGSVIQLVKRHPKAVLMVMGFTAGGSLSYYTYSTYMQTYLVNTAGIAAAVASQVMLVSLFIFMCAQPLFGALSDKIGRRASMRIYGFLGMVLSVPLLSAIGGVTSVVAAVLLTTTALLMISFYTSISGIVKAEMFPAEVRAMGVGLPYAIANALAGGTAPYVALWFKNRGIETVFYYYVAGMIGIAFLVALAMPDARKEGYLQGQSEVN